MEGPLPDVVLDVRIHLRIEQRAERAQGAAARGHVQGGLAEASLVARRVQPQPVDGRQLGHGLVVVGGRGVQQHGARAPQHLPGVEADAALVHALALVGATLEEFLHVLLIDLPIALGCPDVHEAEPARDLRIEAAEDPTSRGKGLAACHHGGLAADVHALAVPGGALHVVQRPCPGHALNVVAQNPQKIVALLQCLQRLTRPLLPGRVDVVGREDVDEHDR
mmetsp:Transcript_9503/g.23685  ORF Transcript_9503/g.23685 Transcript_9503/m.23685 type:complete len:222 (-) Transcript_9503:1219-1884(-)